jgi:hypothetical protein
MFSYLVAACRQRIAVKSRMCSSSLANGVVRLPASLSRLYDAAAAAAVPGFYFVTSMLPANATGVIHKGLSFHLMCPYRDF